MTIDWRKSCVVTMDTGESKFQVLYYGLSADEYNEESQTGDARRIPRKYLEDTGRGRRSGVFYAGEVPPVRYFFTQRMGRLDEEAREAARTGTVRR